MAHRDLREIAEDVIVALRRHASGAEQYREHYVPQPGTGECEATTDGVELVIPAADELQRALQEYSEALFERTGWGAPFDASEPSEDPGDADQ